MSSDLATVDLETALPGLDGSASGLWSESFVKRPGTRGVMYGLAQAGLVFPTAASPATAVPDYWFFQRWRDASSTVTSMLEDVIGRPISRLEALNIAARILEEAERQRLEIAEREAAHGIQWDAQE